MNVQPQAVLLRAVIFVRLAGREFIINPQIRPTKLRSRVER